MMSGRCLHEHRSYWPSFAKGGSEQAVIAGLQPTIFFVVFFFFSFLLSSQDRQSAKMLQDHCKDKVFLRNLKIQLQLHSVCKYA